MASQPMRGFNLDALGQALPGRDWPPAPPLPVRTACPRRRLRVCLASPDLVGPIRNGGIGTAMTALAEALAADGHQVTALHLLGRRCEQQTIEHWIAWYRERGLQLVPLEPGPTPLLGSENVVMAHDALLWLRGQSFDVIHFPESRGLAYFCLLARRQGLAFQGTTFVLGTHSPAAWLKQGNQELLERFEELETDYLERRSLELADVVWSPSQYLLRWERDRNWKLPEATFVQPCLAPPPVGVPAAARGSEAVRELVFFGRLEERKGLVLFCDALEKLAAQSPETGRHLRVTFLGKPMTVRGVPSLEYLAGRIRRLPFPARVVSDKDRHAALAYLREPGRLAVMPSLMENSPFTVVECVREGVPFLASTVGGIPELLTPEGQALLIPPRPDLWAAALGRVIREGAARGQLACDPEANRRAWLDWHARLPPATDAAGDAPGAGDRRPLVSVCLTHFNRPHLLAQALDSLRGQDYPHLEVVLMDDASTDPAALAYLDGLAAEFADRGWRLERSSVNRYASGARNAAARLARGEYLLFMDDDNVAKPGEVSTLVGVARRTGVDLVGCFVDIFEGPEPPGPGRSVLRWPCLGPAVALGLWRNVLGDTNTLFRRGAFFELGGFTEDYGVSSEDHELLARAVLRGYRFEVVPEALFWYRRTPGSVHHSAYPAADSLRALRPYLEVIPPELRPALQLAQGLLARTAEGPHGLLRHRVVDQLNAVLHQWPVVHGLAKSLAWVVFRVLRRATRSGPADGCKLLPRPERQRRAA